MAGEGVDDAADKLDAAVNMAAVSDLVYIVMKAACACEGHNSTPNRGTANVPSVLIQAQYSVCISVDLHARAVAS